MRPAEKLSITLPAEMARMVREKVEGGAYASNSEAFARRCAPGRSARP
jgi:antitoxin ParD1/3/4